MNKFVNLVVFIDGTGNSNFKEPEAPTNVARLWHACEKASIPDTLQRVYYKPGVGTRRNETLRGGAAGAFLEDRVKESLTWLRREIRIAEEDGLESRVFIFGFSRGAYAARWLSQELDSAVEVLGVWDTVKATLKGPDVDVAPKSVLHAFHAMAVDEHRGLFDVTRFRDSPQAVEVWFPGCHSDVGGGYVEAELSYGPLNWMTRMACRYGLQVDWSKIPDEPIFADGLPVIHDETRSLFWRLSNWFTGNERFDRSIAADDIVYPTVAQLREIGYAPSYLPTSCLAWKEEPEIERAGALV